MKKTLWIILLCAACLLAAACASGGSTTSENNSEKSSESLSAEISMMLPESSLHTSAKPSSESFASQATDSAEESTDRKLFSEGSIMISMRTNGEKSLREFLDKYENGMYGDYARVGCFVKINVTSQMTDENRESLYEMLQSMWLHDWGMKERYRILSENGTTVAYFADMRVQDIQALQALDGVAVEAWNYYEIPDNARRIEQSQAE